MSEDAKETPPVRARIEHIRRGEWVFVAGRLEDDGFALYNGQPTISVTFTDDDGGRSFSGVPVSSVYQAAKYAPADDIHMLRYRADTALERAELLVEAARAVLSDPTDAALSKLAALVAPPEDDDEP